VPLPLLEAHGVTRSYGAVRALDSADITLSAGSIHGLVGENGAGKSTFVRIIAGIEEPDGGTVVRRSRDGATPLRLAVVPQYPRMALSLPVWQNLIVGSEPRRGPFLASRQGRRRIDEIAARYDIALDLTKRAGELGGTELRLAALLAALVHEPDVLILDEPTVGLTPPDQAAILATLRRFRDDVRSVLYISHDLTEVCGISDLVTPLVAGRTDAPIPGPVSPEELATRLFGSAPPDVLVAAGVTVSPEEGAPPAPRELSPDDQPAAPEPDASEADALLFDEAVIRNDRTSRRLGPLSIRIRRGVISAITGVRESGLDILEQYLAGEAHLDAGAIRHAGARLNARVDPPRLRRKGIAYIPSDRFESAAALAGSVEENAILQERGTIHPRGVRRSGSAGRMTTRLLDTFDLRVSRMQPLSALSGGTIQKLILARELDRRPSVCIIAEPTAGLDLQSQRSLATILRDLAASGSAVVILSSSIKAVESLADEITVLHDGHSAGTFLPEEQEAIARAFAGIAGPAGTGGCR
jgi:general nucleoside transport system ATP-binding protein